MMEVYINCPECGVLINAIFCPYSDTELKEIENIAHIGKTEHFVSNSVCNCGKKITATLHVTAEAVK